MEELGGNQKWFDRFFAQHIALGYFAMALTLYFINPAYAYNFNQHIEEEAFESYSRFLEDHGEFLKTQPAPLVAQKYYRDGDLYMFDNMSVDVIIDAPGHVKARRPKMNTLYDCFSAIRDDEAEHVKTMIYMQGNNQNQH
jgi:ubiquinol oxidase